MIGCKYRVILCFQIVGDCSATLIQNIPLTYGEHYHISQARDIVDF